MLLLGSIALKYMDSIRFSCRESLETIRYHRNVIRLPYYNMSIKIGALQKYFLFKFQNIAFVCISQNEKSNYDTKQYENFKTVSSHLVKR